MTHFDRYGSVLQSFLPAGLPPHLLNRRTQPLANGTAVELLPTFTSFGTPPGQRLPRAVQQQMETFFATSFDDVRVHIGSEASALGAAAFTHGSDIYFAPGRYNPTSPHGQRLLGHELAHVIQQRAGRVRNPFGSGLALVEDRLLEDEANQLGTMAAFRGAAQARPAAILGPTAQPDAPSRLASSLRMPILPVRSASTIQLAPDKSDLTIFSTTALGLARRAVEFQAMCIGTAVVLTGNVKTGGTDTFLATAKDWNQADFGGKVPQNIRDHTSAQRGKDLKRADTHEAAAEKIATGGLIVLAGGDGALHAEQSLLLVLAHLMSKGKVVRNVVIAGRNPPCGSCLAVLNAFAKWYKLLGYGSIDYDPTLGQDRASISKLDLTAQFAAPADKLFKAFVERYTLQVAGAFVGSSQQV